MKNSSTEQKKTDSVIAHPALLAADKPFRPPGHDQQVTKNTNFSHSPHSLSLSKKIPPPKAKLNFKYTNINCAGKKKKKKKKLKTIDGLG